MIGVYQSPAVNFNGGRVSVSIDVDMDATAGTVEETPASGVGYFEEVLGPQLAEMAKLAERIGKAKAIRKQVDMANRLDVLKQLDDIVRFSERALEQAGALKDAVGAFRMATTEADRDEWTRAFVESCQALNRAVDGEYPVFRIFPIEVKADLENDVVLVNNKTVRTLHPKAIAGLVDKEIERLNRERFNLNQFIKALVRVYDLLLAERKQASSGRQVAGAVGLKQIHALMAVRTGTGSSGYAQNQFAFDVYRLRTQAELEFEGRRLVFSTTRHPRDGIVIALPGGQKEILGSLEIVE